MGLLRRLVDSWFGAVLGGSVYGAWAVWVNWDQGPLHAWGIGVSHWATSVLLTFFGTMAMRKFYGQGRGGLAVARTLVGGLSLTYLALLLVHSIIRTEHVLLTLTPGAIPNILFCSGYALLLDRTQSTEPRA